MPNLHSHRQPPGVIRVEVENRYAASDVIVRHLDLTERRHHALESEHFYRLDLSMTRRLPSSIQFHRWSHRQQKSPGRLFIIPPGEKVDIWNAVGRESVVVCHLYTHAVSAWLDESLTLQPEQLSNSHDVQGSGLEQTLLRLTDEVLNPGLATDAMVEALTLQLAVELQRYYQGQRLSDGCGGLAPWRLRRIHERLSDTLTPPTLTELASLCGLSVRQLSRAFLASRGQSLGQYITAHRIQQAKELLQSGKQIKEIAYLLGFHSSAAFGHAFRKSTGMTPTHFRQRYCTSP